MDLGRIVEEDIRGIAQHPVLAPLTGGRALVAGAGMLGTYVSLALRELKCDVTVLVRNEASARHLPGCKVIVRDLERAVLDPLEGFTHVVNCAGPTGGYVDRLVSTISINTERVHALIQAVRGCQCFVLISSTRVYGPASARHEVSEADYGEALPLSRSAAYDESKRLGETLCYAYWCEQGFPARIVRLSNVYGPFQSLKSNLAIPDFLSSALANKPFVVRGHPENRRNYCYVSDAVRGILLVLAAGENGEAYNIAGRGSVSIGAVAGHLSALSGCPIEWNETARLEWPEELISIEKARHRLGYTPEWEVFAGLERTYRWHREAASLR